MSMFAGLGLGEGTGGTYPLHVLAMHQALLAGEQITNNLANPTDKHADFSYSTYMSVGDEMVAVADTSPYASVSAYDPAADLTTAQAQFNEFLTQIQAFDPDATLGDATALASAFAQDALLDYIQDIDEALSIDESRMDGLVSEYDLRSRSRHQSNVSQLTVGMFDIRAVMTTQFGMELANMGVEREREVSQFDAQLRLQFETDKRNTRAQLISQFTSGLIPGLVDTYLKAVGVKLQGYQTAAQMQDGLSKEKIVAYQDQINWDLDAEVKDTLWNLNLFQYGVSVMSGFPGSPTPEKSSKAERQLGMLVDLVGVGLGILGAF